MEPISKELPPLPPSPATADTPPQQHGLIKRLTTKFRSSTATGGPPAPGSPPESHPELVSGKPKRKPTLRMPSLSGPITNKGNQKSNLENSFTSPEQRQAALRARGLLPSQAQPLRDAHGYKLPLSEQEQQLDRQQAVQVPRTSEEPESEAGKIAEAWMKRNNISSQECSPSSPSKSNDTRPSHAKDSALSASEYVKQSRLDGGTEASNLLKAMKDYRPPRSAPRFRRDDSDSDDSS